MSDLYSIDSHKLHLHPARIAQWQTDPLNTFPIYVEISPVGHCNHRCTFCAVDYIGYKARSLDFLNLCQRFTEMAYLGVKSIMFAGEGEPLLHKNIAHLTQTAANNGLDVAFTTNGVLLDKLFPVLDSIKWIKISLNAGDEETYEKIHKAKKGDWGKVWNNIEGAISRRSHSTKLGVQTVVLPDNIQSIPALIRKAKEFGVDYVVLKPYSQHNSSITHTYEEVKYESELFKSFEAQSTPETQIIARTNAMGDWNNHVHKYHTCNATPYFWAYIMATGDVYTCSAYLLNEEFCMGNINQSSFSDIWLGEKRQKHIEDMKKLDISKCRINCRMNSVNKYLDQIVNAPVHANFI